MRLVNLVLLSAACIVAAAGLISAQPPWELSPPVFEECPHSFTVSTCDDVTTYDFDAIIPERPQARGLVRYRLVGGVGQINEKTGVWTWRPTLEDTLAIHLVEVQAHIRHTDITSEENCRFAVRYRNQLPRLMLDAMGFNPKYPAVVYVSAPGDQSYAVSMTDPDWCDTPSLKILSVSPEPSGMIALTDNTTLAVNLDAADSGHKFTTMIELISGPDTLTYTIIFETRRHVVPVFVACPVDTFDVPLCSEVQYQLKAVDPDFPDDPSGIFYSIVRTGTPRASGYVDRLTGEYRFRARPQQAGLLVSDIIVARYGVDSTPIDEACHIYIQVGEDRPPVFVDSPCGDTLELTEPFRFETTLKAIDPDSCVHIKHYIDDIQPPLSNLPYLDPYEAILRIALTSADMDKLFTIRIRATDATTESFCEFALSTVVTAPMQIVMVPDPPKLTWGQQQALDCAVIMSDNQYQLWGFDLLMGYDAQVLAFQDASPGDIFDTCDWEYFTYRYGADGPCNGNCPSGLMRIVGIAETNNGAHHPTCYQADTPFSLFTMHFQTVEHPDVTCSSLPIRFIWLDCGDNAFSINPAPDYNLNYQELAVSNRVFEMFGRVPVEITDYDGQFPTYGGALDSCLTLDGDTDTPHRRIDFYNCTVEFEWDDSLGIRCATGNVNMNEQAYEISDAALYSNFLTLGPGILVDSVCQAAASDVNLDGIPWTIEDLVYLIRVIVGDALPLKSMQQAPVDTARFAWNGTDLTLQMAVPLGGVYIIFDDSVNVTDIVPTGGRSAWIPDLQQTRVLILPDDGYSITTGRVLSVAPSNALPVIEAATFMGNSMVEILNTPTGADDDGQPLPERFALGQNYPNPFNPETVIPFDLPTATEVTFAVYNVLGKQVYRVSGRYQAGSHEILWQGVNRSGQRVASGVYYYRLTAGESVATKKMLLLK